MTLSRRREKTEGNGERTGNGAYVLTERMTERATALTVRATVSTNAAENLLIRVPRTAAATSVSTVAEDDARSLKAGFKRKEKAKQSLKEDKYRVIITS